MANPMPRPDSPNMDPYRKSFRDLQNIIRHRPTLVQFVQWLTVEEMRFAPDTLMTGNKKRVAMTASMRAVQTTVQLIECENEAPSKWPATPRPVEDYIELSNEWLDNEYPYLLEEGDAPREHLSELARKTEVVASGDADG